MPKLKHYSSFIIDLLSYKEIDVMKIEVIKQGQEINIPSHEIPKIQYDMDTEEGIK